MKLISSGLDGWRFESVGEGEEEEGGEGEGVEGGDREGGGGIGQRVGTPIPGVRKKRRGEAKGSNVWEGEGKRRVLRACRVWLVQGERAYNSVVER